MIWSVRNMAHVDFKALRGTQTVYKPGKNDSKFFKSSRQAQLDRNWENLNIKIDKREVIYTTNQYTVAAIITKHFITQAMRDKLSNETDWLDLKEDHVMLLKRIKTFMTIMDEDVLPKGCHCPVVQHLSLHWWMMTWQNLCRQPSATSLVVQVNHLVPIPVQAQKNLFILTKDAWWTQSNFALE
ncbi:unnamed protein product [Cylindrotheca closterium]|uniref:Uncharacterized protein n=1 Tax=Cylindrotheca closterium TaxID=2856 RepID=A0AAD2FRS0_9STRA|nr:unnamed protein product [Cylindrotheca closterium]